MQKCRTCQTVKQPSEFYKTSRTESGLYERCKICCKIENAQNKAARKAYANTAKGKKARRKYHQSESYAKVQSLYHKSEKGRASLRRNCAKRKTKIKRATPSWVSMQELCEIYLEAVRLEKATGIKYNVDHIVPLVHPLVCGLNVPWNLQLLTETENKVKGNSFDGTYENESWRVKYGISA